MTYHVYIGHHSYDVADEALPGVQEQILDAVHEGGAFVNFFTADGGPEAALITPATNVRYAPASAPIEPSDGNETPDLAYFFDLDL